jgi:hypothetical protein
MEVISKQEAILPQEKPGVSVAQTAKPPSLGTAPKISLSDTEASSVKRNHLKKFLNRS